MAGLVICCVDRVSAAESLVATFRVNSKVSEPANHQLLGYNIFNYSTPAHQEFIKKCDPITIRFPNGVWSNFYNWETDGFTKYGDAFKPSTCWDPTLNAWEKAKHTAGFPGLTALHLDKKKRNGGNGYDILWTYNLNYDDAQKSVARLQDSEKKGFDVKSVEFGNECFWRSQRSSRVATPEEYVQAASAVSKALKAAKPGLRISIPLSWRNDHADCNRILAKDKSYFDAITLHKYIGADPDKAEEGDPSGPAVLAARLALAESMDTVQNYAPGKKIWLSEWGVSSGKGKDAAAALGMADCYLYLFENQHRCERANWFSVNGVLNSFVTLSDKRTMKYPLEKTCFGATYGIIRNFYEDATLLAGKMDTEKLVTDKGSVHAVSACAVVKKGRFGVIAVNLTERPALFTLQVDGVNSSKPVTHQAMSFNSLTEVRVLPFDDNPLSPVEVRDGKIRLPPLSINVITH